MVKQLIKLFNKPCLIGIVGDTNSAKSNMIYYIITELKKESKFNLVTYGLRKGVGGLEIYSIEELEQVKDSVIILDEVMSLWDLDDRHQKKMIENTLRLVFHNNNIMIMCFIPENIKKFIASKLNVLMFKQSTLGDFINGSRVKRVVLNYKGSELGSSVLSIPKGEMLLYDGKHYSKHEIPYLKEYDTKLKNVEIFVKKSVQKSVQKKRVKASEKQNENVV